VAPVAAPRHVAGVRESHLGEIGARAERLQVMVLAYRVDALEHLPLGVAVLGLLPAAGGRRTPDYGELIGGPGDDDAEAEQEGTDQSQSGDQHHDPEWRSSSSSERTSRRTSLPFS
jgi:hypothetical protein